MTKHSPVGSPIFRSIQVKMSPTDEIFEVMPPRSSKERRLQLLVLKRKILSFIRGNPYLSVVFLLFLVLVSLQLFGGDGIKANPVFNKSFLSWNERPTRRFIYVYPVSSNYLEDLLKEKPAFYSTVYDAERLLLEVVSKQNHVFSLMSQIRKDRSKSCIV